MSGKSKDKPEGADWDSPAVPAAPAAQPDRSPEDVNVTPKSTPEQTS